MIGILDEKIEVVAVPLYKIMKSRVSKVPVKIYEHL